MHIFIYCSKELQDALGIVANTLPPFIYRMRELGYPPGWLKEAELETSGLTLYDGKSKSLYCSRISIAKNLRAENR